MAKSQKKLTVPVILCGGMGQRLWPLSRENHPKQLHKLCDENLTLLQQTLLRVANRDAFTAPIIICNVKHRFLVAENLRESGITDAHVILEPQSRNTAPAIAIATLYAQQHFAGHPVLAMPADHYIQDTPALLVAVEKACQLACEEFIVTFGIAPRHPETGYGYIQLAQPLAQEGCFRVRNFKEKPDHATAKRYVASENYLWNSGIFVFTAKQMLAEMAKYQPDLLNKAQNAANFEKKI